MFESVLIANRGEIAVRVIRTLRAMGIRSIAVYSDADVQARHVLEADDAIWIGPAIAAESYLSIDRLLRACQASGAQAVHPGYGFLSERPAFARALARAGVVFIGPGAHAIEVMGDKIRARQAVAAAGIPVVPGRSEPGMSDSDLAAAADEVGYPVLIKPSAGGGGKGMRLVHAAGDLAIALAASRREAAASFGDDTVFIERFVHRPRHIEVQVLADQHGAVLHLGERECSLQRRHQKVVEEAPSVLLDEGTRARIGEGAVATARAVGYVGAGTVEFIVSSDRPDEFFFMEMNTRLQVEHPVTEMVTGLDLVEQQLRVAAGQPLAFDQGAVRLTGHSVEARVYAENPARGFLPTGGTVLRLAEPVFPGVRVDSGLRRGSVIGSDYDPMLSKVIAWGADRDQAFARLRTALAGQLVLGVGTNMSLLRALVSHPDVLAGRIDTGFIEDHLAELVDDSTPSLAFAVYALRARMLAERPDDPWCRATGWRPGGRAAMSWLLASDDGTVERVSLRGDTVTVGEHDPFEAVVFLDDDDVLLRAGGETTRWTAASDGDGTWIGHAGGAWRLAERPLRRRAGRAHRHDGEVTSPLPGTVSSLAVTVGDAVVAGQPLAIIEAMKMEHTVTAPVDGTVADLGVAVGQQVALGELILRVVAADRESEGETTDG
jgi:acetyl-CoA/propionyl-CoA carboxylase biotin carboxyl carrier protein